ncbi:MAG: tape measure protein [Minisyncoccia bacterium]|jgi:tape measure domain-containing protein
MALSVGEVIATFDANIKGFEAGIKKAESQMSGFDKAVSGAGKKIVNVFESIGAAAIGYAKILGVAGAGATVFAVKTAADLQSLSTSFETLTGSAEKGRKVFTDLKKMGATTPFEIGDLAKATQVMLSFGVTVDNSQKYLKMLGDVAMGNKEKLSGLSIAFAQVQGKGKLMGQELLQLINQGFNPLLTIAQKNLGAKMGLDFEKTQEALKNNKITTEQVNKEYLRLTDQMEKGKISADMVSEAFNLATSKGGLFYQGMDRGAKTLAGTFSTLMDNIKMMVAGLAGLSEEGTIVEGSLLDLTQKGVNALNEALSKIDWVKVGTDIRNNVISAIEALRTSIENIINWYNTHALIIEAVAVILLSFGTAFTIVRTAIWLYTAAIVVATATTKGFGVVLGFITGPIGWIVLGLTALIALGYTLWRNWGALTAEGTFLGNKIQWVKDKFNQLKDSINGMIQALGNIRMPKALTDILDKMKGLGNVPGLGNFFKGKLPGFANGVRNFGGGLAVVGEQGPELVNLPKGADVFTNQESRQMVGGAGITIENMNIKNGADWEYGAQFLAQRLRLS